MPNNEHLRALTNTVEEAVTFPLLTYDTSRTRAPSTNGGNASSTTSIAQQTVRNVLGWRYRDDDARGFTAALAKAFTPSEVEGRTEWQWNPQSFTLQADMGGVSGAAASILNQAKNAIDQALPLLDSLTALRPDIDLGNAEAMRSLVRTELNALVNEFSQQAGPRVQRVELFFMQLLGQSDQDDPERVDGYLGRLRERFGLERRRVNTVTDEQNFTNYLILVDYVVGLRKSFMSKAQYFVRGSGSEPFLGTQLVLLSQSLEVILEQVQETYDGMDSVFFGASERQTTVLTLEGHAPITVSELLDWVQSFSAAEGRQLIDDGGKDGIVSFRQNVHLLGQLVGAAARKSAAKSKNPTRAFHSRRVATMLEGLEAHINSAHELASQISRRPINPIENEGEEENVQFDVRPPVAEQATLVTRTFVVERTVPAKPTDGAVIRQQNGDSKAGFADILNERGRTNEIVRKHSYWLVLHGQALRGAQFSLDASTIFAVHFPSDRSAILAIEAGTKADFGPHTLYYTGRDQQQRERANAVSVVSSRDDTDPAIEAKIVGGIPQVTAGKHGCLMLQGDNLEGVQYSFDSELDIEGYGLDEPGSKRMQVHFFVHREATPGWHALTLRRRGATKVIPKAVQVLPRKPRHEADADETDIPDESAVAAREIAEAERHNSEAGEE